MSASEQQFLQEAAQSSCRQVSTQRMKRTALLRLQGSNYRETALCESARPWRESLPCSLPSVQYLEGQALCNGSCAPGLTAAHAPPLDAAALGQRRLCGAGSPGIKGSRPACPTSPVSCVQKESAAPDAHRRLVTPRNTTVGMLDSSCSVCRSAVRHERHSWMSIISAAMQHGVLCQARRLLHSRIGGLAGALRVGLALPQQLSRHSAALGLLFGARGLPFGLLNGLLRPDVLSLVRLQELCTQI